MLVQWKVVPAVYVIERNENHLLYDNIGNERNIETVRVVNHHVASVGDLVRLFAIMIWYYC